MMRLDTYQERATATDHTSKKFESSINRGAVVSLLGLAGELGTLCATYKKYLRDGNDYKLRNSHIREELGDILWYLAIVAERFNLTLDEVAETNLKKIAGRWKNTITRAKRFDADVPSSQRLPRQFEIVLTQQRVDRRMKAVMFLGDRLLGDPLTDNADEADGYRFHDAFHIAFLTVLGWSPVLRKLMGRKRKANRKKDETEDGGRAIVIEEGIAALVFEYGSSNGLANGKHILDDELLITVQQMTRRLEVKNQSGNEWQKAILLGWKAFSKIKATRGGRLICDLDTQSIRVLKLRERDTREAKRLLKEARSVMTD